MLSRAQPSTLCETFLTGNDAPHRVQQTLPDEGRALSYSVREHSGKRHAYPDEINSTSGIGLPSPGGDCSLMPSGLRLKLEVGRLEDLVLGADLHHHLPERLHLAQIVR